MHTFEPRLHGQASRFDLSFLRWLERQHDTVFLETSRSDGFENRSFLFQDPVKIVECNRLEQVEGSLQEVQKAREDGFYAAGYLAYEAGYAFEAAFRLSKNLPIPLLWFGIYRRPTVYDPGAPTEVAGEAPVGCSNHGRESEPSVSDLSWDLDYETYRARAARVQDYLRAGETYQVNLTFKSRFHSEYPVSELYRRLRSNQPVPYSAIIGLRSHYILSFSPELFFRIRDGAIQLKPMKGTAPRGRAPDADERQRKRLEASPKDRAENLMIVDMLRNDVGKIAEVGSIRVPSFFDIETYETVFQATSSITAKLKAETTVPELFRSLFPCGSVTGAPKLRTMEIIQELESEPRGVYCGSIGFLAPGGDGVFNVAIRTVQVDRETGAAEMGIGSGIVADSKIDQEYRECLLKARFLGVGDPGSRRDAGISAGRTGSKVAEAPGEFRLLETLRWDPRGGWFLLDHHMRRLQHSADHFGFSLREESIRSRLRRLESEWRTGAGLPAYRVRLTLARDGAVVVEHVGIGPMEEISLVGVCSERVESSDQFLRHKTTRRRRYDQALRNALDRGWFDMLFLNERDEVTEGARSNLIIKTGGRYYTPPVDCGLLPGTYRAHLLESGSLPLEEKVLCLSDVRAADEIWLCNSVHRMVRVRLAAGGAGHDIPSN